MGKIWLKRDKNFNEYICNGCCLDIPLGVREVCKKIDCGGSIMKQITEQQFNETPGIKYSIKNGVRTELPSSPDEPGDWDVIIEDRK